MAALTERQSKFVLNYINNGYNAYKAAIDAGYSENFAHDRSGQLVYHPAIAERICKAYTTVEVSEFKEMCMSVREKAEILDRIIREVVPKDPTQPIKLDYIKDAIKAIQELNKMSGSYAPDRRLNVTVDATKERLLEAKRVYKEY